MALQPFFLLLIIVGNQCVVQTDNRKMSRSMLHSIKTMRSMAKAESAHYLKCNYQSKPEVLRRACSLGCISLVYADTDTAWTGKKGIFEHSKLIARDDILLLAGIDFPETIRESRKQQRTGLYPGDFNAGLLFIKNCSDPRTTELIAQYSYATEHHTHDDQGALQELAMHGSAFEQNIKYDFLVYGVHSAYIRHWPGAYKSKFDFRIGPKEYSSDDKQLQC